MKIGIIYHGLYPPYNRGIDQLAQSLVALGCDPTVLARSSSNDRQNQLHGIPLIQIPKKGGIIYNRYLLYHLPFNPFWINLISKIGRSCRWEKIIVRDLPMAGATLKACKRLGIPAYLDLRENHASMYRTAFEKNWLFQILHHHRLVQLYEKKTIGCFEHVFTVSEELKNWAIKKYPVEPKRFSVLENTPNEIYLKEADAALKEKRPAEGIFRMVYAGYIAERKGLADIIGALPLILRQNCNVKLRVIGDGPFLPKVKDIVAGLALNESVEFLPMLKMAELTRAIAQCHLGLESCWLNEQTHQTIPGKLFEYMALGIPVVSSNRRSVKRILDEVGCGYVYVTQRPDDIAKVISEFVVNEELRWEMGRRARQAILSRFNWKYGLGVLRKGLSL